MVLSLALPDRLQILGIGLPTNKRIHNVTATNSKYIDQRNAVKMRAMNICKRTNASSIEWQKWWSRITNTFSYIQLDFTYNALFFLDIFFCAFYAEEYCWCLEIFITFLLIIIFFCSRLLWSSLCWPFVFLLLQVFWARILENREYCVGVFYNLNLCADFAVYLRLRKECKEEVDEKKEEIRFNRRAGSCQWIYDTMNETKRLSSIVSPFNWYGEKNTHSIS